MSAVRSALGFLLVLVAFAEARAACGDAPGDAQAVQDARAEIAATCDCAGSTRADYVRCATGVIASRSGSLGRACAAAVKRCARSSTCGRPGAVTCCVTHRNGKVTCAVKPNAAACRTGCVGSVTSCCDACTATGCASTTTTTTGATVTTASTSTTTTTLSACAQSAYPACGASCGPGRTCQAIASVIGGVLDARCVCVDDGAPCGPFTEQGCSAGVCPGAVCGFDASGFPPLCGCTTLPIP
jgi:hypothetical protein